MLFMRYLFLGASMPSELNVYWKNYIQTNDRIHKKGSHPDIGWLLNFKESVTKTIVLNEILAFRHIQKSRIRIKFG